MLPCFGAYSSAKRAHAQTRQKTKTGQARSAAGGVAILARKVPFRPPALPAACVCHLRGLLPRSSQRLCQLRRFGLRHRQLARSKRPEMGKHRMGLHHWPRQQLAPAHLALAHARLPALRPKPRDAPSRQRSVPHRQHNSSFSAPESNHRRNLAQRGCGRAVRIAPAPCRIRRLGFRTKRRAECAFLFPDTHGLCEIRVECGVWRRGEIRKSKPEIRKSKTEGPGDNEKSGPSAFLHSFTCSLCLGCDEQTDARHATVCSAAPRLLAVRALATWNFTPSDFGKNSILRSQCDFQRHHFHRPAQRWRCLHLDLFRRASCKRHRLLRSLHPRPVLADASLGALSASRNLANLARQRIRRASARHPRRSCALRAQASLSTVRLVLVPGNARPGNWLHPGRHPIAGRSLHLSPANRSVRHACLGRCRITRTPLQRNRDRHFPLPIRWGEGRDEGKRDSRYATTARFRDRPLPFLPPSLFHPDLPPNRLLAQHVK